MRSFIALFCSLILATALGPAARPASAADDPLEAAIRHITTLPPRADTGVLAAAGSHEGHWRFVNARREAITTASAAEVALAFNRLAPEAAASGRLAVYLSGPTAFQFRAMLKELPRNAELHVVVAKASYPILRQGADSAPRLFAELGPGLFTELKSPEAFRAATWQLSRTLDRSALRVLSLRPPDPVGKQPPRPPADARAQALVAADPDRLAEAFSRMRGQTALVSGLIVADSLRFQLDNGREQAVPLKTLFDVASAYDVNLLVLRAATPLQPGGRNWLRFQVEIANLDRALSRPTLADFLAALNPATPMLVETTASTAERVALHVAPASGLPGVPQPSGVRKIWKELAVDITGELHPQGLVASLRSPAREHELSSRVVAWIPASLQRLYLACLIAGIAGFAPLRRWWNRIWPPENRADYGPVYGYWAARSVREIAFAGLFMPVLGFPALVVAVVGHLRALAGLLRRRPADGRST